MNDQPGKTYVSWPVRSMFVIGLILFILAVQTRPAIQARRSDQTATRNQYPQLAGTRLDDCVLCHTSGAQLNSYGRDYASSGGNFASIERLDSDGDGFSNIAEINALTFPGSAGDMPQSTDPISPVTDSVTQPATPDGPVPRLPLERIDSRFRTAWERGGGLQIYGLPLTDAYIRDSSLTVQYFERARFEYHAELAGTPGAILMGRLGVELGHTQPPLPAPVAQEDVPWYFDATGHIIAEPFRTFWSTQGGLLTFGYPIGAAFADSNGRLMQYFERARMELHSSSADNERVVLLGFLGEAALRAEQQPERPSVETSPLPAPLPDPTHDDNDRDDDGDRDDRDDRDDDDRDDRDDDDGDRDDRNDDDGDRDDDD